MPIVQLDRLAPGAVLTSPVHDRRGRLLLPPGHAITPRNLGLLRTWGVERVEVALSSSTPAPSGWGNAEVEGWAFETARVPDAGSTGLRAPRVPFGAEDPVRRAAARVAAEARLGLQDPAHPLVIALLAHVEGAAISAAGHPGHGEGEE